MAGTFSESSSIAHALAAALGDRAGRWSVEPLGASGFCATWRARAAGQRLFVKSMPAERADVLEAEADGLAALAEAGMRAPAVAGCWHGASHAHAVLAMEWLDLRAPDRGFGARFGEALARLHRKDPPEASGRFGWRRDNLLGSTPQVNDWSRAGGLEGWLEFFAHRRLQPMRDRLASNGAASLLRRVDNVIDTLPRFFDDGYVPRSSLIHGDLWGGNWGMLGDGTPVVFDPAVSCSDAEAELAMMELFASLPAGFVDAYTATAVIHGGYRRRRPLYQLYHLLNHAVLFGGGYIARSESVAAALRSA